jgi:glycosyltransferase involved in cell wall biosynthesis
MKRVSIIGSVGVPAKYGGFETLTENIVVHLREELKIVVYCSSVAYPEKSKSNNGAILKYVPLKANGWQSVFYDGMSLLRAAFNSDVCLVLGVSGAIFFPILRIVSRARLVCNPDGLEWKRAKWSGPAKAFLKFSEWLAVKSAHTVIADSLIIKEFIADRYGVKSIFIPYGGDHIVVKNFGDELFKEFSVVRDCYFLNISRIEPENNSGMILEAFSRVPDQTLVMIGNWGDSSYGKHLYEVYRKCPNIRLLGAMFDRQAEKNYLRANCKGYVHGHSVGGTSPALVEALTLKRIPVCFDVSYNRSTCDGLGLYFRTADDLVEKITQFDQMVDIPTVQANLQSLCDRRYRWKDISAHYFECFNNHYN